MSLREYLDWGTTELAKTLEEDMDSEDTYTPYEQRMATYIVPIVFALIFIIGVLGNGTLVVIFFRHRSMRNVPNTYILSLALADLLVIVTCVPYTAQIYTVPEWTWGLPLCKLSETTKDVSIGVSVFTLTALSVERYCAIVNPLRRFQIKPLTMMTAILIWMLAVVLALPGAFMSRLEVIPLGNDTGDNITVCSPYPAPPLKRTYARISVVCKAFIYYVIPLSVITIFYVLMARRLRASTRDMPGEMHSVAQYRARRHVARMVMAFVFLFFICFLPHHVFMLWFWLNPSADEEYNNFWHVLRIIGFCLSFLNSCVNPIALYCVSGLFRKYFNYYLCCRKMPINKRAGPGQGDCETSFNSMTRRSTHVNPYSKEQHSKLITSTGRPRPSTSRQVSKTTCISMVQQTLNQQAPIAQQTMTQQQPIIQQTMPQQIPMVQQTMNQQEPMVEQTLSLQEPIIQQTMNYQVPMVQQTMNQEEPMVQQTFNQPDPIIQQTMHPQVPMVQQTMNQQEPMVEQTLSLQEPIIQQTMHYQVPMVQQTMHQEEPCSSSMKNEQQEPLTQLQPMSQQERKKQMKASLKLQLPMNLLQLMTLQEEIDHPETML